MVGYRRDRPRHRHDNHAQLAAVFHSLSRHRPLPRVRVSEGFTQLYDIPADERYDDEW